VLGQPTRSSSGYFGGSSGLKQKQQQQGTPLQSANSRQFLSSSCSFQPAVAAFSRQYASVQLRGHSH
jgi:hypothetical protein